MTAALYDEFVKVLDADKVSNEEQDIKRYSHSDELQETKHIRLVVWPASVEEVKQIVECAIQNKVALIPVSSAGPRLREDSIPKVDNVVIVDLSKMNQILRVDRKNRVAMIEPGVTFDVLIKELKQHGLRPIMPLLPKSGKSVLACCLDREPPTIPRFHWDISDPLLCTEVVFGTGDIFRTGSAAGPGTLEEQWVSGQAQKNPMGPSQFDPYRLIQGSQGTIGIVTWISLKCEPVPEKHRIYVAGTQELDAFQEFSYAIFRRRLIDEHFIINSMGLATALKKVQNEIESLREKLPNWILIVGVSGHGILANEEFEYRVADTIDIAQETGISLGEAIGPVSVKDIAKILNIPSEEPYWKLRFKGGCRELLFTTTLDRVSGFYQDLIAEAKKRHYPPAEITAYVQPIVHGTSVHCSFDLYYDPTKKEERERVYEIYLKSAERLMEKGAFFSRPFGPIADMVFKRTSPEIIKAMKTVKSIFDPHNILNPGTLCFKEGLL